MVNQYPVDNDGAEQRPEEGRRSQLLPGITVTQEGEFKETSALQARCAPLRR